MDSQTLLVIVPDEIEAYNRLTAVKDYTVIH